ncbi:MAG: hypothetical protein JWN85_3804 [Gammaproteobacteria bacterium]|nr:hypothetical protein [Gammaproteobacteria bacterium]
MGPLSGVKIIEVAGVGTTPFCGMVLADPCENTRRGSTVSDDNFRNGWLLWT